MKIKHGLFLVLTGVAAVSILSSFKKQTPFDLEASITRGKEVYASYCQSCHMDEGQGVEGVFPPLA